MSAEEQSVTSATPLIGSGEIISSGGIDSHDWSQTPLGAIETWSDDLKASVQRHFTELAQVTEPAQTKSTAKTPREFGWTNSAASALPQSALPQIAQADAFRVRLTDALRPLRDATEIQAIAAQILGEALGASRVIYIEVVSEGEEVVVHCNYTHHVAPMSGCYRLEEYHRNLAADHQSGHTPSGHTPSGHTPSGHPQIVTDIAHHPEYTAAEKAKYREIEIAAHIDVPLIKNNQFVALLAVHQSTPRQWTEIEVKWVEETAEQTWAAVERARAEADLRKSEAKYRTLFESIDQGFCLIEVLFDANNKAYDYRYLEVNQAFEQQSGLTNAVGKTIRELVPDLEPQWGECYEQVVRSGEAVRLEADVPSMNRVFDIYAVPSGAPGQNLVSVLFTDITERKGCEANLAFLAEIQDDCARLTTAEEIMQTIGEKIGAYLNLSVCAFIDIDESQDQAVIAYSWHRADVPNLVGTYRISNFVSEEFYVAARAGAVVVVNDTNTDTRTDTESCAAISVQAFIHVPFLQDGQWKFLFNVYDSCPRHWHEDEIELFTELANRIFPRIERARAEVALRQSEERYRMLFNSIDEGFCVCELIVDKRREAYDYRILEVNPAFEALTGLTQAPGKTGSELIPGLEPFWYETYARVVRTGEPTRFESYLQAWDRWFTVYVTPIDVPQSQRFAVLFSNITERKRVEDERKQSEAIITADLANTRLLRDLSARLTSEDNTQVLYDEIVAAAIALTRADAGTVQILDDATQDLLLLASQGFDRTLTDYFYRVDASSNTPCGIALTRGTRTIVDFDVPESDDPQGSLRLHANAGFYCAQSTPLISRSGKAIGMVSTHWCRHYRPSDRELRFLDLLARQAADLIEQRQTEAERKRILEREQAARQEAERANRIKDEFLAVLSHELRSPLNPILGWTRLLQNGKLDETRRGEALKTIERNARLQAQLIEDLLDISRIMQGKLSLTAAAVDLSFVLSAAIETVRLSAEAKQIQITLNLDPAVASISGDAARLQQVVWNLLTNAVKFTPNGGRVSVELRQIDGLAQIRVMDTGKGINPEFLPYVFDYFRQEDGSTTRKFGGLGLGLAIARQIVEMHGGTIWAESQGEGLGATFIVQLPTPQQTLSILSELAPDPIDEAVPLAGIQVLLVDDEPDTREFQAFLLEQYGARVKAVASGVEALQALEQLTPDVLVSDIGMAEMDGYMLLQQIRSRHWQNALRNQDETNPAGNPPLPKTIALTAYAAEVDQQRVLQAGFQAHLTKPVEPEALVRTIATLLERT